MVVRSRMRSLVALNWNVRLSHKRRFSFHVWTGFEVPLPLG